MRGGGREAGSGVLTPMFRPHRGWLYLCNWMRPGCGGSDGNFTGAMGIPTLDGLGVLGAGGHTLGEHLLVDSLVPRGRLLAGLLATVTGS